MLQQESHILTEMEILFMPSTLLRRTQPSVRRSSGPPALWSHRWAGSCAPLFNLVRTRLHSYMLQQAHLHFSSSLTDNDS